MKKIWRILLLLYIFYDSSSSSNVSFVFSVKYSEPLISNRSYICPELKFNPNSMDPLYMATKVFMDIILRKNALPSFFKEKYDIYLKDPLKMSLHWKDILLQYIGVITIVILGLIGAIITPIIGIVFCCFKFCKKNQPQHSNKKIDKFKRCSHGFVLGVFVICSIFGVIMAFVTNIYSNHGLERLPRRLISASFDSWLFFENVGSQTNDLLVTNFGELENTLHGILNDSGSIIKESFGRVTQAAAIDELKVIVSSLGDAKKLLQTIKNQTTFVQDKMDQLNLAFSGTKLRLKQNLSNCSQNSFCAELLAEFDEEDLFLEPKFFNVSVPGISEAYKDIEKLIESGVEKKVNYGQEQLNEVIQIIETSMNRIRPDVKKRIGELGSDLKNRSSYVKSSLDVVSKTIINIRDEIADYSELFKESFHLFYVCLGLSILVLVILCCYIFGLFYGFCGKQSNSVYDTDCCNKRTGAKWIISGVYFTFGFSWIVLSLVSVFLFFGSISHKLVCDSLSNPEDSDLFTDVIDVHVNKILKDRNLAMDSVSTIISNCHKNKTVYDIFNLSNNYYDTENLKDWKLKHEVENFFDNLKVNVNEIKKIQILPPQTRAVLESLADSSISRIDFGSLLNLKNKDIMRIDLPLFIRRLRRIEERIGNKHKNIALSLNNEALFLDQMQKVGVSVTLALEHLIQKVTDLDEKIHFSSSSFGQKIKSLIDKASEANGVIHNSGPQIINDLKQNYTDETISLVDRYVDRIILQVDQSIGKCWPLSSAYNSTVKSLCHDIVDPFNGFWASLALCYSIFLLSIAFGIALEKLYKKSRESYGRPLDSRKIVRVKKYDRPSSSGSHRQRSELLIASESNLPETTAYRTGYSFLNNFQDESQRNYRRDVAGVELMASSPPEYTPVPNLVQQQAILMADGYGKPPPYNYS